MACSRLVPFAKTFLDAFCPISGNTAWMGDKNEETALRATAQIHQVVEELRVLITAAAAAQLQANRASWDPGPGDSTSHGHAAI